MNCYKKILSTYDSLPKQQKKIADYIVLNINEVVFFSITMLASELSVSEATIEIGRASCRERVYGLV